MAVAIIVKPSPKNNALKWISLIVLLVQTTALVLILRYSRTQVLDGHKYISSTVVLVSEIIKFITSSIMVLYNNEWSYNRFRKELQREVFDKPGETLKVGVPAILYVVQNNLLFFALSKLDAATYQVTCQLKVLTTAFFFVILLGKRFNLNKWAALILLTAGVALVQVPKESGKVASEHDSSEKLIGLIAVLIACMSSGFAGVFFEKILKGTSSSIWMRNLQLAFFSIYGAFLMTWIYDREAVEKDGFLQGYNIITWIVVLLQAYGGLIVAVVVKYGDNIVKGFAVSLSIIFSSFISWFFLNDFEPSITFASGALIVIASTFLYGYESKPANTPI